MKRHPMGITTVEGHFYDLSTYELTKKQIERGKRRLKKVGLWESLKRILKGGL